MLLILIYLTGCGLFGKRAGPEFGVGYEERGLASWYGIEEHGKKTASGETFNMFDYTAAHRSLPFNSLVEVTNLKNDKKVVVRINDRGPFVSGRIIDLSYISAKKIDMLQDGVVPVRIRLVGFAEGLRGSVDWRLYGYYLQVGAFVEKDRAYRLLGVLAERVGEKGEVCAVSVGDKLFYRVLLGPFKKRDEVENLAVKIERITGVKPIIRNYR